MVWGSGGFKSCEALLDRVEKNDPQLIELVILPMKTFGEAEVERLANILSSGTNTYLRSISASGHRLSPMALEKLGNALSPTACNVRYVAVGDEDMKDDGVESFCRKLSELNGGSIESVDFSFKSITSVGTGVIGRTFGQSKCLKRLDLYRNPEIREEGMIEFSLAASSHVGTDGSTHTFERLQHLDFSECGVGPTGIKALVECLTTGTENVPRLNQLELQASSNPFESDGCEHLKNLISNQYSNKSPLTKLSIKKCNIGDEGLASLVGSFEYSCDGFEHLDIAGNGIGAKGLSSLATSLTKYSNNVKSLKELNLANNAIGDDGVLTLARSLKEIGERGDSILKVLDLSSTKCGINGAVDILKCPSLKSVRLFNNNLGSEGFEAITPLLVGGHATLEHLDLGGNRAKESDVARLLRAIMVKNDPDTSVLQTIELGGNEVGDEVEDIIKEMRIVRPGLDVARDRPSVEQPSDPQGGEMKI